jgi:hypothetical protein
MEEEFTTDFLKKDAPNKNLGKRAANHRMGSDKMIPALLFSLVLICYIVVICVKDHVEVVFHTSIVSVLTFLATQLNGVKFKK